MYSLGALKSYWKRTNNAKENAKGKGTENGTATERDLETTGLRWTDEMTATAFTEISGTTTTTETLSSAVREAKTFEIIGIVIQTSKIEIVGATTDKETENGHKTNGLTINIIKKPKIKTNLR